MENGSSVGSPAECKHSVGHGGRTSHGVRSSSHSAWSPPRAAATWFLNQEKVSSGNAGAGANYGLTKTCFMGGPVPMRFAGLCLPPFPPDNGRKPQRRRSWENGGPPRGAANSASPRLGANGGVAARRGTCGGRIQFFDQALAVAFRPPPCERLGRLPSPRGRSDIAPPWAHAPC